MPAVLREPGVLVVANAEVRKLTHEPGRRPVHATYVAGRSCPADCPMMQYCYAKDGHVAFIQRRLDAQAQADPHDLLWYGEQEAAGIDRLPGYGGLRIHVYGDTPTEDGVRAIAAAVRRFRDRGGFFNIWFTHVQHIPREAYGDIAIMRSVETIPAARRVMVQGFAPGVVVPEFPQNRPWCEDGITLQPCPAQVYPTRVDCDSCRLCSEPDRLLHQCKAIAFKGHGMKQRKLRQHLITLRAGDALPIVDDD